MDTPRAEAATSSRGRGPIVARGARVREPSLLEFLSTETRPRGAWFTDAEAIATRGETATISATGEDRFDDVRRRATALFERTSVDDSIPHAARPRLFGGFSFHHGPSPDGSPWAGYESGWFVLPAIQLTWIGGSWWVTVTASGTDAERSAERKLGTWVDRIDGSQDPPVGGTPIVADRTRTPSRRGWRSQVRAALERIARDELEKVVLAQSLSLTLSKALDEPTVLDRLGDTYPDCCRFMLSPPDAGTFFGATPERLVSRRGRTVRTEALAGSTGRGETSAEDEWLAEELRESRKDRHEHDLVVDAICDQLAPLASSVSTGPLSVRRLPTVQHLETAIAAELHTDDHVLSLVDALHPTPAVGGLPPDAALETITETEQFDRGWYAAPVGWFDAAGNGTFAVAIRSALTRDTDVHLFAGAGIVADSDPDREWDEVQLKYGPMLDELE